MRDAVESGRIGKLKNMWPEQSAAAEGVKPKKESGTD
jgi:hypothetical protein